MKRGSSSDSTRTMPAVPVRPSACSCETTIASSPAPCSRSSTTQSKPAIAMISAVSDEPRLTKLPSTVSPRCSRLRKDDGTAPLIGFSSWSRSSTIYEIPVASLASGLQGDADGLAVDAAGGVRCEERDGRRHLAGLDQAPRGRPLRPPLPGLVESDPGRLGLLADLDL